LAEAQGCQSEQPAASDTSLFRHLLGHADLRMLQRYTQVRDDRARLSAKTIRFPLGETA
jgi:site-specific recombinase XerD